MKRHKSLFGLLLLFVGLLTSCEEHEVLQAVEEVEEQEVHLKDYQATIDAQRGKKPQRTNDQTQATENYGEKGHDRRGTNNEYYGLSFKYADRKYDNMNIGELYVIDWNIDDELYTFKFFFPEVLGYSWKEFENSEVIVYQDQPLYGLGKHVVYHNKDFHLGDTFQLYRQWITGYDTFYYSFFIKDEKGNSIELISYERTFGSMIKVM
ncbi:MAG: hypothetical protein IJL37_07030 [Bacteroidaceae bacterium]|nr:hypothetical protein [Bacteroidaceae bacterium]